MRKAGRKGKNQPDRADAGNKKPTGEKRRKNLGEEVSGF